MSHIVNNDKLFTKTDSSFKPEKHFIELPDGSKSINLAKEKGTGLIPLHDSSGNVQQVQS